MQPEQHARHVILRSAVAIGLAGIALIHLLDSTSKFNETPYVGWLYVALMVGSLFTAGLVATRGTSGQFALAAGLALGAIAGYVLSRTTGLPSSSGDIGNWKEPLGMASLFVEGCVVAASAGGMTLLRTHRSTERRVARDTPADLPLSYEQVGVRR